MNAESMKTNGGMEDLVTSVFNELSSSGFLEQLRLECVTNVKTMSTYLQLKKRFVELLNKKLSNADWKFEVSAPRLSILREQIVECSVLAVTIERVVDEVVSWKLREQIVPIIKEILCACYDHKTVGKLKLDGLTKLDGGNPSFSQLEQVIKKICSHIHVDWKHVFKDEMIGKSLASVSVSHNSDDEVSSSDESGDTDSEVEIISDDTAKKSGKSKRKIEIIVDEEETRSKRERKMNSKYFSDIYDTPVLISTPEPGKPLTPEPVKSPNDFSIKRKENNHYNSIKKTSRAEKNEKSIPNSTRSFLDQSPTSRKYPKVTEITIKSEHAKDKVPITLPTQQNYAQQNKSPTDIKPDIKNGFIRKSERQHKPNSRLFWEPGDSPQKTRTLIAEEADQDLKQMELSILKTESPNEITQRPQTNFHRRNDTSFHKSDMSYDKNITSRRENQREQDSKKKNSLPESSSQKYSMSELYKPRPLINGTSKRRRPRDSSRE